MAEPDTALTTTVRTSMPFAALPGMEVLSASPDEVHARTAWDQRLCTAGEILQGGALMGLADATGAYCTFLDTPIETDLHDAGGKHVARVTQTQAILLRA